MGEGVRASNSKRHKVQPWVKAWEMPQTNCECSATLVRKADQPISKPWEQQPVWGLGLLWNVQRALPFEGIGREAVQV
jgi:hypothetical protein